MADSPEKSAGPQPPASEAASTASIELFQRCAQGDEQAADELFRRYVTRLVGLARSRMSAKLAARLDPDDVVMSAYRSFFIGARRGRFALAEGGDLWKLLAEITMHKLYRQTAHHRALRRSVEAEANADLSRVIGSAGAAREPSPELAAAVADELELVMSQLPPLGRRVLELRLQGEQIAEIAAAIGCSDRTVRRLVELARQAMLKRVPEAGASRVARRRPRESPIKRTVPSSAVADAVAPLRFADYLLHQQLGSGAAGKIYRATHKSSGCQVAVKYLKKAFLRDDAAIARFVNEAQVVMQLRHPGIVPVYGLGRTLHGGYFIVMELIEGGDLDRRLAAGPVSVADAVRWVCAAAEAVAFAHQLGIVHCDLKPSNVLLGSDGRVLVTDFGLARRMEDPEPTHIAGTPAFMAPEQIDPVWGAIGPHTDVYGLGAVLFTLLVGRPPFPGTRAVDVMADVACGRPIVFPDEVAERLPPPFVALCRRSLAKPPADRFPTAAALLNALRGTADA